VEVLVAVAVLAVAVAATVPLVGTCWAEKAAGAVAAAPVFTATVVAASDLTQAHKRL
jgi:hypothetical protein